MKNSDVVDAPLLRRERNSPIPLTPMQSRIWNGALRMGKKLSGMRMCVASVRVLGRLDAEVVAECLESLALRHEALRTNIIQVDGLPQQLIQIATIPDFGIIDLSTLPPSIAESEARSCAEDFISRKIDLQHEPPFSARLISLPHSQLLFLAIDHMFSDAMSCRILNRDFWALYYARKGRQPVQLPELSVQFPDYAVWLARTHDTWVKRHSSYWREQLLSEHLAKSIADGDSCSSASTFTRSTYIFALPQSLSSSLKSIAARKETLLPLLLFSFLFAACFRSWERTELVLALMSHGRRGRPATSNMVGYIANILHIRVDIVPNETLDSLLEKVNLGFRNALQHEDFDRVPGTIPGYQQPLTFNWLPASLIHHPRSDKVDTAHLRLNAYPLPGHRKVVDQSVPKLVVQASDTHSGLAFQVLHCTRAFPTDVVAKFCADLKAIAECHSLNSSIPIALISPSI